MSLHRSMRLAVPLIASGLALACGASQTGQTAPPPPAGYGQLALSLVDAPASEAREIWVKVTAVNVHRSGSGWLPVRVANLPLDVDLLRLQDSALFLGYLNVEPGTITQVRLVIDPGAESNYVVLPDGTHQPLKVPSGAQSGIKIHGPWQVSACTVVRLTLDFDGHRSLWYHPTGRGDDTWILRPVIRATAETDAVGCATPIPCDPAGPPCADGECLPSIDPSLPDPYYCVQPPGELGDTDAPCAVDADCQSDRCETGVCAPGEGGVPCGDGSDCQSGLCVENVCTDLCGVEGLPPGSDCSVNGDCQSNVCDSDGKCGLNQPYDPCRPGMDDCDAGAHASCSVPEGACMGLCLASPG